MKKILTFLFAAMCCAQVFGQATLTEVYLPQYMQGNSGTNSNRLTYVCRLTLSGLSANATYRYFIGAVDSVDLANASGAGTPFYLPNSGNFYTGAQSLSTAGSYHEFTSDGSGAYTGWFGLQPSTNSRFTSGRTVNIRIMLNNGAGGTAIASRLTTTSGISVLNLGTTSALATGIRSVSCGDAKNLVFLWDNASGTGRPIAGAALEDDGYTVISSYATFYRNDVDGSAKAWGTLIPNTLANGIRRIEQFSLSTGSAVGTVATDADGTWPTGSVNTVNPSGGTTALVIANADAPLAVCPSLPELSIAPTPGPLNGFCAISPNAGERGFIRVSGINLSGAAVSVSATSDFEVSLDGITYSSSVSPSYTAPTLSLTDVFVRLKAGLSTGAKTGTITFTGGGAASSATLTVNGTVGAATSLGVSDIIFTGLKTTTPGDDQIAFLATVDIPSGTDILFTDRGWDKNLNVPAFNTAEQTLTWNSGASAVAKGTVVRGNFASGVATWNVGYSTGNALDGLSNGGESVIAYQLSSGCPSFIHGVNSVTWLSTGAINTNSSYLPDALNVTNGNVVSGGTGSRDYTGSRSCNTMSTFKNLVNNNSNWSTLSGSNLDATAFTEGLSVSISVSPNSHLENDNAGVTITATACSAVPSDVTVNLSFSGTATAATDYSVSAPSITISSGNTIGTITLNNVDDVVFEGNETVIISISSVSGGGAVIGSPATATYTITENDDAVYFSCASGATNGAIWSIDPACPVSGTVVFSSANRFVIQSGHTIEMASSPLSIKSLDVQSGGKFWRNSSVLNNMRYLSVHDYINNEGTIGSDNGTFDAIGLNMEGANVSLYGGGIWNVGRIRKAESVNTTSNATISDATINVLYPGAAIYNNQNSTTFNLTIAAGATVNVTDTVTMDGTNGLSGNDRAGTITVNGTLNVSKVFLARAFNPAGVVTALQINPGGKVWTNRFLFNGNVAGGVEQFQVTVNGYLEIYESLDLEGGTFNSNNNVILTSTTVSHCAIIDDFSSGYNGSFSGTATFQRYYTTSSATNDQHIISAPVNNPSYSKFASLSGTDNVYVTPTADCDETATAINSNYGNIFEYDESNVQSGDCYLKGWKVRSAGNATNGKGFSLRKAGSGTLNIDGAPNFGTSYTVSGLTNSNWSSLSKQGRTFISGYHPLGNPYPASLDIENPDPSEFANIVKLLNTTTGQFEDVAMSGTDVVAPFQGFQVLKLNNGNTADFTIVGGINRKRTPTTFYKTGDLLKQLTIEVEGPNGADKTYVNFISDATPAFDPAYDGFKMFGDVKLPSLYTELDGAIFSTNTVGNVYETPVVPLHFEPNADGNFTLNLYGAENFEGISSVWLHDKAKALELDITQGATYTFIAKKQDPADRFYLRFEEATVSSIQPEANKNPIKVFNDGKTIHIDLGVGSTTGDVQLFNTLGEQVGFFELNTSYSSHRMDHLSNGTYFARVKSRNNFLSKKIIVVE